jgi:hypothetical protein
LAEVGVGEGVCGELAVSLGGLLRVEREGAQGGSVVGVRDPLRQPAERADHVGGVGAPGDRGEEELDAVGGEAAQGDVADAVADEVDALVEAVQVVEETTELGAVERGDGVAGGVDVVGAHTSSPFSRMISS